jgi:NTE family protein
MRLKKGSRTALVLAGGGITGAVYEIGALRAIDDLLVDRTVNDFDIYVGTSAGALVSAFLANGVSPETQLEILSGAHKDVSPIERKHIFALNRKDYFNWGKKLPGHLIHTWYQSLRDIGDLSVFDLMWSLSGSLPPGFYDGLALARYLSQGLDKLGCSDDFNQLERELYVIATELDSGKRAIFGPHHLDAPISQAVAASSALPLVYKPVKINGHEYIDGGMRGTASIDIAIEHGATMIVCINPLVPFENEDPEPLPGSRQSSTGLSDKGVPTITNQAMRIILHSGLHYHIKQLRRSHPEVDIILIEPRPKDYEMFFYNIMHYSSRLAVAQHGFESVTYDLARDYHYYKDTLARHRIPLTRRLVIEELAEIEQSNHDPQVIRKVLEAKSGDCGRRDQDLPYCRLSKALAELELLLELMEIEKSEGAVPDPGNF